MINREEKDTNTDADMKFGVPHILCVAKITLEERSSHELRASGGHRKLVGKRMISPMRSEVCGGVRRRVHLQVYLFSDRLALTCWSAEMPWLASHNPLALGTGLCVSSLSVFLGTEHNAENRIA
jgi:hypothetical protein